MDIGQPPEDGEEDDSVDDIFLLSEEVDQSLCCLKKGEVLRLEIYVTIYETIYYVM